MIIKSLTLENYRSFKERTQLDFKNVNIFVGPNMAGKSNIIKCLQFLNSVARNDWSDLYFENVFDSDVTKRITIEVEFSLNLQERKEFVKRYHPTISTVIHEDNPIFKQLKYAIIFQGDESIYKETVFVTDKQGKYEELISNKTINTKSMFQGVGKSYVADLIIEYFRKNIGFHYSTSIQDTLNFQDVLTYIHEKEFGDFYEFLGLTKDILGFPKIHVNRDPRKYRSEYRWRLKNNRIEFADEGLANPLPFFSLSYGSQQLLHILILVGQSKTGQIICIEEPENGLHSYVQKRLFKEITDNARKKNVQFFITTHSPLYTTLEEDIVATYLVTRNNAVSEASIVDQDSRLKLVKQHLGIDNSDIYLSSWVVFIEGDSEEISIPIIAEAMEHGEIGSRIRLINYRGKGNIKKLTQLLRYLKYFDTEPIVMGDGHKEVRDAVEDFTRERLIKGPEYAIVRQNGNEFEDLFESNKLVKAMKKIFASKLKFELTTEELEAKRTNRKAADILEDYMFNQNNGIRLDKMQLAKELALDIANEIKNNVPREETKFEQEIKKILETIEKA